MNLRQVVVLMILLAVFVLMGVAFFYVLFVSGSFISFAEILLLWTFVYIALALFVPRARRWVKAGKTVP